MTTIVTGQVESGDVDIKTLSLTKLAGGQPFNITGQVTNIDVYEDIEQPGITVVLSMADGIGLLKSLPIVGEEWLDIEFDTPGRDPYKARFHVHEVSQTKANAQQTMQYYQLICVSEETFQSSCQQVEKGYNETIDQIIGDILSTNLGTDKKYFYEQTKGPQQIAFTRKRPWQAVEMLKKRACSQTSTSSSYFFFENKYGFNFNTLEYLMDQNSSKIGDKIFTRYTSLSSQHESNLNFRHIVDYNTGKQFSMVNAIRDGALNNIHQSFDMITKKVTEKQYTLPDLGQFGDTGDSGAVSPFTTQIYQNYGSTAPVRFFSMHDSSKPDTYIPDFLSSKIGFLATQLHGTIDIHVYGDSSITVGDVITIEVPKSDGMTKTTIDQEPLVGGNYLVSKARHMIAISHAKPKYTMALTLIRGTYKQ